MKKPKRKYEQAGAFTYPSGLSNGYNKACDDWEFWLLKTLSKLEYHKESGNKAFEKAEMFREQGFGSFRIKLLRIIGGQDET